MNMQITSQPCSGQDAAKLAEEIREKLRGEWHGVGGLKDGIDLGLAARIIDAFSTMETDIMNNIVELARK